MAENPLNPAASPLPAEPLPTIEVCRICQFPKSAHIPVCPIYGVSGSTFETTKPQHLWTADEVRAIAARQARTQAATPSAAEPPTRRSYPVCEVCESEIVRDERGDWRHKNQMQPFADTTYLCDRYGYPTRPQKEE